MQFFVSAGEPSGDLHGSNLIRELRQQCAAAKFVGFGGPEMAAAGCDLRRDMSDLAIMGFARVLPHLKEFWRLLKDAERHFRRIRPDAVILIDYPGFNWWVAKRAKRYGIPVFYYGTPQIWAWATHRVHKLRKRVDHALCKLPFEPEWYNQRGCSATYVGHPYFDSFLFQELDSAFMRQLGQRRLVTLLPGSRNHEVRSNLPSFLKTIHFVGQTLPEIQFAIASYNQRQADIAREIVAGHSGTSEVRVYVDRTRELIHCATCCLACSGSVSLELLHEAKPTVMHYKIDRLGDYLQRCFRRCKFITLVNLLTSQRRFHFRDPYDPNDIREMSEAPFPEYLSVEDCSAEMAHHLVRWLVNEDSRQDWINRLAPLRSSFVRPGASHAAARYILEHTSADAGRYQPLPKGAKVA